MDGHKFSLDLQLEAFRAGFERAPRRQLLLRTCRSMQLLGRHLLYVEKRRCDLLFFARLSNERGLFYLPWHKLSNSRLE